MDRLARFVATVGGVGRLPVAPGTWGSLIGLAVAWWLAGHQHALGWWPASRWYAVAGIGGLWLGVPAASRVAAQQQRHDPQEIVIDETVGMLWALAGLPHHAVVWLAGFGLFRLLDIAKPWPIRACERLPGGWGIMADDLAAGVLTNLCLRVLWQGLRLPG